MESGELRIVSKAAKQQWDFYRDNKVHLKQQVHNFNSLKFKNTFKASTENKSKESGPDGNTLLVKIGLANINTPSVEHLQSI